MLLGHAVHGLSTVRAGSAGGRRIHAQLCDETGQVVDHEVGCRDGLLAHALQEARAESVERTLARGVPVQAAHGIEHVAKCRNCVAVRDALPRAVKAQLRA